MSLKKSADVIMNLDKRKAIRLSNFITGLTGERTKQSMEEKTFVGYGYGNFQNDRGEMQAYCNVFMLEDFNGTENSDYRFGGQKAVKYKCINPDVWKDIKFGTRVKCFFDSKNRISYMVPADSKA